MSLTAAIKVAILHCIKQGIPFVVYRESGCQPVFIADCGDSEVFCSKFIIKPWNSSSAITVYGRCDAVSVLNFVGNGFVNHSIQSSTSKDAYLSGVEKVISRLRLQGGKTVISRTISFRMPDFDIAEVADQLFDTFPKAFCNLYYTPQTGAWIGATPETLLHVDTTGHLSTMALAGTIFGNRVWDDKNLQEHRMVVEYISKTLSQANVEFEVKDTTTLGYGQLTHLCTPFRGTIASGCGAENIADMLSPTPAVAGYPREVALNEIALTERHERRCYAGYLAIEDEAGFRSYVNLRCAEFDNKGNVCAFAGGGITADSVPEDEWNESQAKASALISLFNNCHQIATDGIGK